MCDDSLSRLNVGVFNDKLTTRETMTFNQFKRRITYAYNISENDFKNAVIKISSNKLESCRNGDTTEDMEIHIQFPHRPEVVMHLTMTYNLNDYKPLNNKENENV